MSGLNNPVVGTCSVAIATKMPWNDAGYRPPQVHWTERYHVFRVDVAELRAPTTVEHAPESCPEQKSPLGASFGGQPCSVARTHPQQWPEGPEISTLPSRTPTVPSAMYLSFRLLRCLWVSPNLLAAARARRPRTAATTRLTVGTLPHPPEIGTRRSRRMRAAAQSARRSAR